MECYDFNNTGLQEQLCKYQRRRKKKRKKREYVKSRYKNISDEKKQKRKKYLRNSYKARNNNKLND